MSEAAAPAGWARAESAHHEPVVECTTAPIKSALSASAYAPHTSIAKSAAALDTVSLSPSPKTITHKLMAIAIVAFQFTYYDEFCLAQCLGLWLRYNM